MSRYGLVLAGGGAKGAYQIGIWQAIRELDIEVGAVSGTSIGALNGALFVQGDWEKAREMWGSITMRDIVNVPEITGDNLLGRGNAFALVKQIVRRRGLDTEPLRALLCSCIDEDAVRNSPIEFGVMTYSLKKLRPVPIFKEEMPCGELIDYLLASACFPVFKNVHIESDRFIDGGVYDNAPAQMLVDRGYKDLIIVEIGGIGPVRKPAGEGLNILHIQAPELGGLFDLNSGTLASSIERGYLDGLRLLGARGGETYCFLPGEYRKLGEYRADLEMAGCIYGLDTLRQYSAEEFLQGIRAGREENRAPYEAMRDSFDAAGIMRLLGRKLVGLTELTPVIMERYYCGEATARELRLAKRFMAKELAAAQAVKQFL